MLDARAEPGSSGKGACRRISEQVGISAETLPGWIARAEIDAGIRPGTTTVDNTTRISDLEREVRASAAIRALPAAAHCRRLPAASSTWLRSINRLIIGVKISCMASSIFPPGHTTVFARDMNESCSIESR